MSAENRNQVGAVMVVGGGIAGIQVSLDLAKPTFLSTWWKKSRPSVGYAPNLPRLAGGRGSGAAAAISEIVDAFRLIACQNRQSSFNPAKLQV
jgi:hypothetical protein